MTVRDVIESAAIVCSILIAILIVLLASIFIRKE